MKLFLLSALLVVASGCHRAPVAKVEVKPPEPSAAETEFIRAGMKLQEYCAQGVTFDRFAEQLATTKVAYRLAAPGMQSGNSMRASYFDSALASWDATLLVWRRQIKGGREVLRSEPGLAGTLGALGMNPLKYGEQTPKEIAYVNPDYPSPRDEYATISTVKLVRIGLAEGSSRFQSAIDFVDVASELEKIRRARAGK